MANAYILCSAHRQVHHLDAERGTSNVREETVGTDYLVALCAIRSDISWYDTV